MYNFNPGDFRHKISFLSPPSGRDDYGAPTGSWPVHKSVYASIEPLLGKELYTALSTESGVEAKFRTRYISGVTDRMGIQYGADIYMILSLVNVNNADKELLCYCKLVR